MRKTLITLASVIGISASAGGVAAAAPINPGGVADAAKRIGPTSIARVCREVCRDGFCRRDCFYERDTYGYDVIEPENDGYVVERRRVYREAIPPVYHERRYGPGIRLHFDLD